MDTFEYMADRRRALADLLDGLDDAEWTASSWCDGWQVRHVAGHLNLIWSVSLLQILGAMIRHRGYDRANFHLSKELGERSRDQVIEGLRDHADDRRSAPGLPPESMLSDIVIHTQDIAVPLGLDLPAPEGAARRVLDFVTSKKAARFRRKGLLDGLRFVADDFDWSLGRGPEVRGRGDQLATAIFGRAEMTERLSGDGVATLAARLT